ncbi:flagellar basal body rod protein FlgC [Paracoccus suum]|uniref:Flagellar basal body rod protein FlgC n=1 Tax=Paracoccus suum TaxID=2259340 RepID=A0A344PGS1_9RHOB|nr:flagellar basal body rod protein FlgC [Paracoccus suum]AXC48576.1 flagellar basal body rod protein FlgC [Paracoccus suum]
MADLSPGDIAASGLKAQAIRLRHVAENIANADTPGYRRKMVAFEPGRDFGHETGGVVAGRVQLDRTPLPRVFDPSHPMADAQGFYDGSGVDLVVELADSREASRSYEANLKVFEQSRAMNGALLDLLRR